MTGRWRSLPVFLVLASWAGCNETLDPDDYSRLLSARSSCFEEFEGNEQMGECESNDDCWEACGRCVPKEGFPICPGADRSCPHAFDRCDVVQCGCYRGRCALVVPPGENTWGCTSDEDCSVGLVCQVVGPLAGCCTRPCNDLDDTTLDPDLACTLGEPGAPVACDLDTGRCVAGGP
ncbi:hypothetical protein ACFL51_01975 [Myxococcota bacterium]